MSDAFHGYGSVLQVGDGASPEAFVSVAELSAINIGPMSTAVIDATHLTSANTHREKLAGMKDTGPFTVTGNYLPEHATQANTGRGLLKLWADRTVFNGKVVLSDTGATEWPFTGFISNFQVGEVGADDKVTFTCEITPETQVTTIP
jgi:predicted secreted protein